MKMYLELALTISAGLGFVYGLFRFFRKDSASSDSGTYLRMIVFGLGCAMLGRLYGTLMLLVKGEYYPGFDVGMLGIIGSFLFFFSANFGQVDSVVDDGYTYAESIVAGLGAIPLLWGDARTCFLLLAQGLVILLLLTLLQFQTIPKTNENQEKPHHERS